MNRRSMILLKYIYIYIFYTFHKEIMHCQHAQIGNQTRLQESLRENVLEEEEEEDDDNDEEEEEEGEDDDDDDIDDKEAEERFEEFKEF